MSTKYEAQLAQGTSDIRYAVNADQTKNVRSTQATSLVDLRNILSEQKDRLARLADRVFGIMPEPDPGVEIQADTMAKTIRDLHIIAAAIDRQIERLEELA